MSRDVFVICRTKALVIPVSVNVRLVNIWKLTRIVWGRIVAARSSEKDLDRLAARNAGGLYVRRCLPFSHVPKKGERKGIYQSPSNQETGELMAVRNPHPCTSVYVQCRGEKCRQLEFSLAKQNFRKF